MFQAQVECQNYGLTDAKISAVTLDLSMSTVNSIPAAQAQSLLTKTFNGQPGQQITHDSIAAIGVLGALQAGKYAFVAAGPFGWVVAGVALATQYIIPLFTANQIPLDFSNQCGNLQNGMMLAAGASMTCTTYIQKPPKGYPLLPGTFTFNLLTDAPPIVGPPPNPSPVQLRRPERGAIHVNPDRLAAPVTANASPLQPNGYVCWMDATYGMVCNNPSGTTLQPSVAYPQTQPVANQSTCSCAGSLEQCLASCTAQLSPVPTTLHINPDAVLGTEQFRAALKLANAAIAKTPEDPATYRTAAILLRYLGENEIAEISEGVAKMKQARMEHASVLPGLSARLQ